MPTQSFRDWLVGAKKIPEVEAVLAKEFSRKTTAREAQTALRDQIEAAPPDMTGAEKRALRFALEDAEEEEGQADKAMVVVREHLAKLQAVESLAAAKPLARQYRTVSNRLAVNLNAAVADSRELIALIEGIAALGFRAEADGLPKPPMILFDLGSISGPMGQLMPSPTVFDFGRDSLRMINRFARLKGFSL